MPQGSLQKLLNELCTCPIDGMTDTEKRELELLKTQKKALKTQDQQPSQADQDKLKELGQLERVGALHLRDPFCLRLDWWQSGDTDDGAPIAKTWAGRQEIRKIARAAQETLILATADENLLSQIYALRTPSEYRKDVGKEGDQMAGFYFDAQSITHSRDVGFSLDKQKIKSQTSPAIELLCLIGLQRFHPHCSIGRDFTYGTWTHRQTIVTAVSLACCMAPLQCHAKHTFRMRFRDDQRRYKAYAFADSLAQ
jgi:CRISPR-associated protein Csx14